jgi:hypothetical protein
MLAVGILLITGCVADPVGGTEMRFHATTPAIELLGPRAEGDRIEATLEPDRLLLDVHSASGIGRARILRPAGGWPDSVEFRLHLPALEGFEVRGATGFTIPATLAAPADGPIEIRLPDTVVDAGTEALWVQWIDRYR